MVSAESHTQPSKTLSDATFGIQRKWEVDWNDEKNVLLAPATEDNSYPQEKFPTRMFALDSFTVLLTVKLRQSLRLKIIIKKTKSKNSQHFQDVRLCIWQAHFNETIYSYDSIPTSSSSDALSTFYAFADFNWNLKRTASCDGDKVNQLYTRVFSAEAKIENGKI